MRTLYRRVEPRGRDDLSAAVVSVALAVGVGALTFYMTRLLLARDVIREAGDRESKGALRS